MIVSDILNRTTQFFKEKGISTARLDTELLIGHAMKWTRVQVYMHLDYPLSDDELETCRSYVRRRSKGEPIAYIVEKKFFYKSEFEVQKGVLIPRPETELLVEEALKRIPKEAVGVIMDLGVGSGCIGLSLLRERPGLKLLGFDISETALHVTTLNAQKLQMEDRVSLIQGEVESTTPEQVLQWLRDRDWHELSILAVTANPPYIDPEDKNVEAAVKEFEPHEALFSPDQGLFHVKAWLKWSEALLPIGACAFFEMGSTHQRELLRWLEETKLFQKYEMVTDLAGFDRHVIAEK